MSEVELIDDAESLAAALRVKPATVRGWARQRKIPFLKVGRLLRFERAKVLEHLERSCRPTGAPLADTGGSASRSAVAAFIARQEQAAAAK